MSYGTLSTQKMQPYKWGMGAQLQSGYNYAGGDPPPSPWLHSSSSQGFLQSMNLVANEIHFVIAELWKYSCTKSYPLISIYFVVT